MNWVGVDLDGTLAHYDGWKGPTHIGTVIPAMLDKVRAVLRGDYDVVYGAPTTVRIFTARACIPEQVPPVQAWLKDHGLGGLDVTNRKDFEMVDLWDDRARRVVTNTGEFAFDSVLPFPEGLG